MSLSINQSMPKLDALPLTLPRDEAVSLELVQGVLIFRVSQKVQDRIEELLDKQHTSALTSEEAQELNQYEDIDDYLSFINRLLRNISQEQQTNGDTPS